MISKTKEAYVFVAEGFEEIETVTIIDLLRRAEVPVRIVSITTKKKITGSHGITIGADCALKEVDLNQASALILPGGMPGAEYLSRSQHLTDLLQQAHQRKLILGAICAAPIVLGRLMILKNRKATCYPGFEQELIDAKIQKETTVVDDNIITSVGIMSAIEFSLTLIQHIKHAEAAQNVGKTIFVK